MLLQRSKKLETLSTFLVKQNSLEKLSDKKVNNKRRV